MRLDWKSASITAEGIAIVVKHTSRFEADPANAGMIQRLRLIEQSALVPTDWDKRYYTHEIREYQRYSALGVSDGQDPGYEIWNDAHTATLEDFQLSDTDVQGQHLLYHPDTLK